MDTIHMNTLLVSPFFQHYHKISRIHIFLLHFTFSDTYRRNKTSRRLTWKQRFHFFVTTVAVPMLQLLTYRSKEMINMITFLFYLYRLHFSFHFATVRYTRTTRINRKFKVVFIMNGGNEQRSFLFYVIYWLSLSVMYPQRSLTFVANLSEQRVS